MDGSSEWNPPLGKEEWGKEMVACTAALGVDAGRLLFMTPCRAGGREGGADSPRYQTENLVRVCTLALLTPAVELYRGGALFLPDKRGIAVYSCLFAVR